MKTIQLRRYAMNPGMMQDFESFWSTKVVPLRKQHGFTVEFAYRSTDESEFIWGVSLPGDEQEFLRVQEKYNNSPERALVF